MSAAPTPTRTTLSVAQLTARIEAADATVLLTITEAGDVSVVTQGLVSADVPRLLRDTATHLEGP